MLKKLKYFLGNFFRFVIFYSKIDLYSKKRLNNINYYFHIYFFFFNFKIWAKSKKNKNFQIFLKNIINKKIFIDIGAHIGLFSLVASKRNKKIKIFSFEPSKNFFFLKKHIKKNNIKNIHLEKKLVLDFCKIKIFYETTLPKPTGSLFVKFNNKRNYKSITIDKYVGMHKIKPDIIKIDVEGSEHLVLFGAKKTIEKFSPIIYLSYHPNIVNKVYSKFLLLHFIKNIKYKIFNAENNFLNDSLVKKELILKKC